MMRFVISSLLCFFSYFIFSQNDSVNFFLNSSKHDTLKIDNLLKYSDRVEKKGDHNSALNISTLASELALKKNLQKLYIKAESYKAFSLIKINKYDEATILLNNLLSYSLKNNLLLGQAHAKRLLGLIELYEGNFDISIKIFIETQKLWESNKDSSLIISGLGDIGTVFFYQKDYENAIKYWETTGNFYSSHNRPEKLNIVLSNLALVYIETKKFDEAEKIFNSILSRAIKNKENTTIVNIYTNLASLEHAKGNEEAAIEYTIKSIHALDGTNELSRIGSLYCNLGELYRVKNDFINARKSLHTGLRLILKSQNIHELSHAYQNLAVFYESTKNYQYALAYKDTFYSIRDSIYNIDKQEQILKLEHEFESKQKEEQIELLNKDKLLQNSELKKQRYVIYFFIICSILLFVLIFFIYRSYKTKRIANHKLELQKKEILLQKTIAEEQKLIIEEKQKEIIDSIKYAQRIQQSLLPTEKFIERVFKKNKN
jgi:tetratricopeptide (TPR) repeat protein